MQYQSLNKYYPPFLITLNSILDKKFASNKSIRFLKCTRKIFIDVVVMVHRGCKFGTVSPQ